MEYEEILGPQFSVHWSTCSPIPGKRFPITSVMSGGGGWEDDTYSNNAIGNYSAVIGGVYNWASGELSTVSGGDINRFL